MRTRPSRLALSALVVAAVAALQAAPAGSQAPVEVEVTKVIVGTQPPGATFIVELSCQLAPEFPPIVQSVTFTQPGTQTVTVQNGSTCQVSEPQNGGASSVMIEPNPVEVSDGGAVTVTNTFVPAPPTSPARSAPVEVPEPVAAAPAFTG